MQIIEIECLNTLKIMNIDDIDNINTIENKGISTSKKLLDI